MLKLRSALIAAALTASAVTVVGTAAEAAPSVTIHKIAGKTIPMNSSISIRPKITRGAQVSIGSKTITVKAGNKTVVDHKRSARLKAGTYRVTTRVDFATWRMSGGERKYSKLRHVSKTQTLRIKTKAKVKPKPAASHPCTTTSSGTCIQGGQFCPQAKYGQSGWDAKGRRYVCTGDSTHPHWMTP